MYKTPCISVYIYVRDEKRQGTTATTARRSTVRCEWLCRAIQEKHGGPQEEKEVEEKGTTQKGRTHNGRRSRTIIDRRGNTWPGRIAATDSDWLTAYLYYGIIRATLYPDGGRTPDFWAPRRTERDREPPRSSFRAASSSAESHELTKGRDAHAVDLRRLIWRFEPLCLDFVRVRRASMPRAVTEKVAAHFPVPFVRGPREKARTGRMRSGEREGRALLPSSIPPSHPREVNARESFPLLSLHGARSIRTRLFGTPFSFAESAL